MRNLIISALCLLIPALAVAQNDAQSAEPGVAANATPPGTVTAAPVEAAGDAAAEPAAANAAGPEAVAKPASLPGLVMTRTKAACPSDTNVGTPKTALSATAAS